ncbi:MAG: M23 family metallopeptidase [Lachnospiraceae bacterium]|nr:M23 family metallopeptidase [Robinsoniella sp.]MDY3765960.1 M23 family metallopeptidase [Lachnospiraceae bacterium]
MKKFFTKKSTIWALSLCLMGGLSFAGYYSVNQLEQKREEQQNKIIDLNQEEMGDTVQMETQDQAVDVADQKVDYEIEGQSDGEKTEETEEQSDTAEDVLSDQVEAVISPTVDFQETDVLIWPTAGEILIDYSMNGTIYFPTLNQYKYNPALVIGQEVNAPVIASAKGIVKSITVDEETGTTVTMDLGNDYELIYGQLKELAIQEGQLVEQGDLIGYVSEPTKYYCVEGSNLYFQMKKDGEPVDPVLYLEGE